MLTIDVNSEAVGQQQQQEQGLRERHRKSVREREIYTELADLK